MFTSFRKFLSSFKLILLSLFLSAFRRQVWIQLQDDVRKSFWSVPSLNTTPLLPTVGGKSYSKGSEPPLQLLQISMPSLNSLHHLTFFSERAKWCFGRSKMHCNTSNRDPGEAFHHLAEGWISFLYPVGVSGYSQKQSDFSFMTKSTFCSRLFKGGRGRMKRALKWNLVNSLLQIWSVFSISKWTKKPKFSKKKH